MYHQQRFYTNNEGLNDKLEPDEIAQYQGIVRIMQFLFGNETGWLTDGSIAYLPGRASYL